MSDTSRSINPDIFKAYDIRGIYPDDIDEEVAYRIGRGVPRVLSDEADKPAAELRVGVGRDMRLSSPDLADRFAEGIRDEGADVIELGQVATEMVYFAVGSENLDGGLMCTASHNSKEWNGAKIVKQGAIALSGDAGLGEIRDIVTGDDIGEPAEERGQREEREVGEDFRRAALGWIDAGSVREMKVVLDGGHGMAGPMVGPILDELPIEQVKTYWEPDGNFPEHEPNPMLEENRQFVIDKVLSEGAELGIAWDGDADRCFFVDDAGEFVSGDFVTALLAESILEKEPEATILYDVRASRGVREVIERAGGTACMNRVGHAYFKTRMRDMGAAFGGEVSGHYYFRDFYNADSGTLPALLILELLSAKDQKLSELLAPYREKYHLSGEINQEVDDQEAKMQEIAERYGEQGAEISELDGVSVDFDDWHFNVRPSNTEPLLRLNLESLVSENHMAEKRDEVLELIRG